MKKIFNFWKAIIDKESKTSSKRFILVLTSIWALCVGTFYVISIQFGGSESMSTVGLIQFAIGSAVTLAVGGTAAEAIKKK